MLLKDLVELLPDKEQLEDLKEELQELEGNRAYQLVLARLEQLKSQDLRLLVAEELPGSQRLLQGRLRAVEQVIKLRETLLAEVEAMLQGETP